MYCTFAKSNKSFEVITNNKEIPFINIAKTLAIFLIIMAHLNIPYYPRLFIGSFRMPLFFILSGYLISSRQYDFIHFVKRKAKTLLIPYAFFVFVSLSFWYFFGRNYGQQTVSKDHLQQYIIGAIFSIPTNKYMGFNLPIWFLPSLFFTEIMFYLCRRYCKKTSFLVCCFCFALGIFLKEIFPFCRLPFGLDVSVFALLFIYIGYWLRKKQLIERYVSNIKFPLKICFVILFGLLTFYIASINDTNGPISMVHRTFNNYFLYFAGAFSGSLFLIFVSNCIPNHHLFHFYGRNTIIILGFHLICFSFIKAIQVFIFHIPLETADNSFWINFSYALITFVLLYPVIYLINKYAPFLLGREKGIL